MNTVLILILIALAGVIGFIIGRKTAKPSVAKLEEVMDDIRKEAHEALAERKGKRKERILEMLRQSKDKFAEGCNLREGENRKGVTTDDVEKLLDVSSSTAGKYLNELEDEKKIKQVGISGRNVYYILVK